MVMEFKWEQENTHVPLLAHAQLQKREIECLGEGGRSAFDIVKRSDR